jgi:hypothetical protein
LERQKKALAALKGLVDFYQTSKKMATKDEVQWKRFTDPAFIENLWKLFAEHLDAHIKVDSEWAYHGLDERRLAAAVIRVCTWAKLRRIFETLVLLKFALPEISGLDLRKWHNLWELAEEAACDIGLAYFALLRKGDYRNRIALEELIATVEDRFELSDRARPRKSTPFPWHCWTALAAIQYLRCGIVPARKQVLQAAIECRALFELMHDAIDPNCLQAKISELEKQQPKNWKRIIRELGLVGLPHTEQRF